VHSAACRTPNRYTLQQASAEAKIIINQTQARLEQEAAAGRRAGLPVLHGIPSSINTALARGMLLAAAIDSIVRAAADTSNYR
jgi:hypothetical protein